MATRRSPRLKGSPKPELPPKPRPPKRVQNAAEDSVRQANFQVELAEWQAAKVEHDKLMQKRKRKQNAATKAAARKAPTTGEAAPPPAAPPAEPPAAPPAALASPSPRLLVKATSPPGRCSDPTSPAGGQRGDVRFPGLRRSTAQWALDVEAVALRCEARGAGEPLYPDGEWFEYGVCLASNP